MIVGIDIAILTEIGETTIFCLVMGLSWKTSLDVLHFFERCLYYKKKTNEGKKTGKMLCLGSMLNLRDGWCNISSRRKTLKAIKIRDLLLNEL